MRAEGGGEAGFPSPPLTCEPFPATVGGGHMQEESSSGSPDHLATLLLLLASCVFTSVAASRLSRSLGFSSMVTARPALSPTHLLSRGQSPKGMGSAAQGTKPA